MDIEILYNTYYDALVWFANRLLKDEETGYDIVSEVFEDILRMGLDVNKSFLYTAVKNKCFNKLKSDKRKSTKQVIYMAREEDKFNELAEIEQCRSEVVNAILLEIEGLPAKAREVFKLKYLKGLSNNQIAERLNITVFTVRSQTVDYLKRLRTSLLKKGITAEYL